MGTGADIRLSVILPAFNEERSVERTVRRAVASLRKHVAETEIILIDDCSQDATPSVVDALGRELPEVRVVHNERNLRHGGSLQRGFAMARFEYVTHNAVDYPFDYDDLPALLGPLAHADVVVAVRHSYPGVSLGRALLSQVYRALIRTLFATSYSDYNFVQIYRREVLERCRGFSRATPFITPEIIIRAVHAGYRVVEVPIEYHPRLVGKPSSATVANMRSALVDMGKLFAELRLGMQQRTNT